MGDLGSIPALGRSPGEGNGYPLQYSGMENSKDSRVTKSWTQLKEFHSFFFFFFSLQKLREGIIHIHISLQGISGKYSTAETRTRKRPCCMWKKPQLNPINMPRKIDTRGKDRLMGSEYRVILKTTNNLRDLPAPVPLHEVKKEC